ncbi:unnamed protein product [Spirodela intermedia]|uniref:Uncharacterized protein n=1 Tax=Spirodela intermedia TaxID=51605 RepID=A0A7I8JYY6_SPIIN|nr:unnamed protein product [Spirodela intermedia]
MNWSIPEIETEKGNSQDQR